MKDRIIKIHDTLIDSKHHLGALINDFYADLVIKLILNIDNPSEALRDEYLTVIDYLEEHRDALLEILDNSDVTLLIQYLKVCAEDCINATEFPDYSDMSVLDIDLEGINMFNISDEQYQALLQSREDIIEEQMINKEYGVYHNKKQNSVLDVLVFSGALISIIEVTQFREFCEHLNIYPSDLIPSLYLDEGCIQVNSAEHRHIVLINTCLSIITDMTDREPQEFLYESIEELSNTPYVLLKTLYGAQDLYNWLYMEGY